MIKSFFNLSLTGMDSSTSSTTSSISEDQDSKSSLGGAASSVGLSTSSAKDVNLATQKSAAEEKVDETAGDAEQNDEEDEEAIKEAVQTYAEEERLAPFRAKQLLKKALKPAPPDEPDPSECCGSSCTPCVKDLWREEVRLWKTARGIDPYGTPTEKQRARYPHLDW